MGWGLGLQKAARIWVSLFLEQLCSVLSGSELVHSWMFFMTHCEKQDKISRILGILHFPPHFFSFRLIFLFVCWWGSFVYTLQAIALFKLLDRTLLHDCVSKQIIEWLNAVF